MGMLALFTVATSIELLVSRPILENQSLTNELVLSTVQEVYFILSTALQYWGTCTCPAAAAEFEAFQVLRLPLLLSPPGALKELQGRPLQIFQRVLQARYQVRS